MGRRGLREGAWGPGWCGAFQTFCRRERLMSDLKGDWELAQSLLMPSCRQRQ